MLVNIQRSGTTIQQNENLVRIIKIIFIFTTVAVNVCPNNSHQDRCSLKDQPAGRLIIYKT